ncbi:hypothetical protein GWK47_017192 [Chionoecetes opilio]|uniref:G protein-coupled receptor n=1 Tax=Chionoecetes opilio TaxID=41210 RepID=A0A8J5CJ88_CHIOP|nr:hypothetical protein GWK47_017192 [Chionoecetes opilio]
MESQLCPLPFQHRIADGHHRPLLLNTTLPVIITAAAYSVIIVIIQRNKRRLAGSQPQGQEATTTMDQATRAMLALFISNLVFGLPYSIFRLLGQYPIDLMHHLFDASQPAPDLTSPAHWCPSLINRVWILQD